MMQLPRYQYIALRQFDLSLLNLIVTFHIVTLIYVYRHKGHAPCGWILNALSTSTKKRKYSLASILATRSH